MNRTPLPDSLLRQRPITLLETPRSGVSAAVGLPAFCTSFCASFCTAHPDFRKAPHSPL